MNDYATTVMMQAFRELDWRKSPGKPEIFAELSGRDDLEAVNYALAELVNLTRSLHGPNNNGSISTSSERITVHGNDFLRVMVNRFGVDFNGASAYRAPVRE